MRFRVPRDQIPQLQLQRTWDEKPGPIQPLLCQCGVHCSTFTGEKTIQDAVLNRQNYTTKI